MAINRNMKSAILQVLEVTESKSGAKKKEWINVDDVDFTIAIYKGSNRADSAIYNSNTIKVQSNTHIGITNYKSIKAYKNRIIQDDIIYEIISVSGSRKATLMLKEVIPVEEI